MMIYEIFPYLGLIIAFCCAYLMIHSWINVRPIRFALMLTCFVTVIFVVAPAYERETQVNGFAPFTTKFEEIPEAFTYDLNQVELENDIMVNMYELIGNSKPSGAYNPMQKSITISLKRLHYDMQAYTEVLYHEVGHHVWYWRLSKKEREQYEKIYAEAKQSNDTAAFVSDYATTSVSEDFAESFATYYLVEENCLNLYTNQFWLERATFIENTLPVEQITRKCR